nr:M1 family metallopeptidase [Flavobacteriales bacterium]
MYRLLPLLCAFTPAAACYAQATFQQRVDHTINVRLDDVAHVLHGEETIRYTNNSSTALDTLWMHLWPNAYSAPNTALDKQLVRTGELDLHFATPEERGGIDSLDFRDGNDTKLNWGYHPQHSDIAWVKLAVPVMPGTSTTLRTPFRVKIPDGKFSRLGHTGQAYYITQWFPKPAVYDAQGWHTMPYLTQGEFFCEFGHYDVSITLPANYVVGATGVLQNSAEQAWMDSLAAVPYADPRRFKVDFQRNSLNAFPPTAQATKTLRYVQDDVHDFAWFADKRFIVRKDVATLPDSKRSVTVWALFTPKNAEEWEAIGTRSLVNSVVHYSEWLGDYPYEVCTAVDGTISAGGGMEYPMITIIGDMGDVQALDNVIAHEVGHNWFQGILASNERDHPWMDEGMNSFVELTYMRRHYPGSGMSISIPGLSEELTSSDAHRMQSELGYRLNARRNLDQGLCLHSAHYTSTNYGTNVYMKSALAFDHLLAYLGEADMKRCMRGYYAEFKFRHPAPADVQRVFERESDKDLNWLFKGFLCTDEKYRVKAVSLDRRLQGGTEERLHLGHRAKGPSKVPFPITGYLGADSLGTIWDWNHGFGHQGRTEYTRLPWPEVDRVRIDAGERRNNTVRSSGLFKRTAAPRFKFLAGLEQQDRGSVFFTPAIAANGHDGLQVGLLLHNTTFPSQRTEWVVAPLYGLGSEHLGGAARIEHHFDRLRSRLFQNIHLGLSARSASTLHDHF